MKIYTDEYMKAINKIEEDVHVSISEWINEIGNDIMIDCRNISTGDNNEFKNEFSVNPKMHRIDISNELRWSVNDTDEDVSKRVCRLARKSLLDLIEKKIEESDTRITVAKDVRKFIKVVYEDVIIEPKSSNLSIRIGIEEYKRG